MDRKFNQLTRAVGKQEAGRTLVSYLQKKFNLSAKAAKTFLEQGGCRLNGVIERFGSVRLQQKDRLDFDEVPAKKPPPPRSFSHLFEDNHLLICCKPPGIVSEQATFVKLLNRPVWLVHRLDKETSGVMVVAKTPSMQQQLAALFKRRQVAKSYFAVVQGQVKEETKRLCTFVAEKTRYEGQTVWQVSASGKRAMTDWRCIRRGNNKTLLQCWPHTGRTHQLRVHLSSQGHPILGDVQYGGRHRCGHQAAHRLFLHAYALSFVHPVSGQTLSQIAPLPEAFRAILGPQAGA